MMTTMSEMINFECMARKAQSPPPPSSGWVVAWRRCLDGSTILVQVPTPDAKLDARGYVNLQFIPVGYKTSLCKNFLPHNKDWFSYFNFQA